MGAAMSFLGAGMSLGGMGESFCFVAGTQVVVRIDDEGRATLHASRPEPFFLGNAVLAIALVVTAFEGRRRLAKSRRDEDKEREPELEDFDQLDHAFAAWDGNSGRVREPIDTEAHATKSATLPDPLTPRVEMRHGQHATDAKPASLATATTEPRPATSRSTPRHPRLRSAIAATWLIGFLSLAAWFGYRALPAQPSLSAATRSAHETPVSPGKPRYITKNIEDIRAGDTVVAMDPVSGEVDRKRVVADFSLVANHLRILKIADADHSVQTLQTTDEHPFWLPERQAWVASKHLTPGDLVIGPRGELQTVAETIREEHPEGLPVYNFEVEDFHSYFVREQDDNSPLLSHNAKRRGAKSSCSVDGDTGDPNELEVFRQARRDGYAYDVEHYDQHDWRFHNGHATEMHHTIPVEVQQLLPDHIRRHPDIVGRRGNPNKIPLPTHRHQEIHPEYNNRFISLINQNGGANEMSVEMIQQIRAQCRREFGI